LQAEIEAAAEEITGDVLSSTADNFLIDLQRVQEVKGAHIEHMFTRRP